MLTVSASDNLAIQAIRMYNNTTLDEWVMFGSMTAASEVSASFDVSKVSGFVYIDVMDYALNIYTLRISVEEYK